MRFSRIAGKKWAAVLSGAVLTVAVAGASFAHTSVAESYPAAGEEVESAPAETWVRFGTAMLPVQPAAIQDASLQVVDACGKRVDEGESTASIADSKVTVASGGKVSGRYELHWFATALDGAEQSGAISFEVAKGKSCKQAVRTDAGKDVDLGFDFTKLVSKKTSRGATVAISTKSKIKCSSVSETQRMVLGLDTDADGAADLEGELACSGGRYRLVVLDGEEVKTTLKVKQSSAKSLSIAFPKKSFPAGLDVFATSAFDSDDCADQVCVDRAPDLGAVAGF